MRTIVDRAAGAGAGAIGAEPGFDQIAAAHWTGDEHLGTCGDPAICMMGFKVTKL